jgi:hypothetical protein
MHQTHQISALYTAAEVCASTKTGCLLESGENTSYLEVYHMYYPKGTPDFY